MLPSSSGTIGGFGGLCLWGRCNWRPRLPVLRSVMHLLRLVTSVACAALGAMFGCFGMPASPCGGHGEDAVLFSQGQHDRRGALKSERSVHFSPSLRPRPLEDAPPLNFLFLENSLLCVVLKNNARQLVFRARAISMWMLKHMLLEGLFFHCIRAPSPWVPPVRR